MSVAEIFAITGVSTAGVGKVYKPEVKEVVLPNKYENVPYPTTENPSPEELKVACTKLIYELFDVPVATLAKNVNFKGPKADRPTAPPKCVDSVVLPALFWNGVSNRAAVQTEAATVWRERMDDGDYVGDIAGDEYDSRWGDAVVYAAKRSFTTHEQLMVEAMRIFLNFCRGKLFLPTIEQQKAAEEDAQRQLENKDTTKTDVEDVPPQTGRPRGDSQSGRPENKKRDRIRYLTNVPPLVWRTTRSAYDRDCLVRGVKNQLVDSSRGRN